MGAQLVLALVAGVLTCAALASCQRAVIGRRNRREAAGWAAVALLLGTVVVVLVAGGRP